jgi:hypothetical protein
MDRNPDAPLEILRAAGSDTSERICYSCRRSYPDSIRFCPKDGVDLDYVPPSIADLTSGLARPRKWLGLSVLVVAVSSLIFLGSGRFVSFSGRAKQHGELLLNTTPPGATIYLDGSQVGTTPIRLSDIVPGVHEVRAMFPGYQNGTARIEILPSAKLRVVWDLVPLRTLAKNRYVAEFLAHAWKDIRAATKAPSA